MLHEPGNVHNTMPKRTRKRGKSAKKYPAKRRRYDTVNIFRPTPSRNMGPLGVSQKATFYYHEQFSMNIGISGTPDSYMFSANGLYDPNITGVGHQPRGFDQLVGTLYDHYVVIASRIHVWAQNTDTSQAQSIALIVNDNPGAFGFNNSVMENRYVKVLQMSPAGSGQNCGTMSMYVDPNKFLYRSKPLSDPDLKGSSSANPAEQAYWQLYLINKTGNDTLSVNVRVRIEYQTILLEPRQPTES